MRFHFFKAGWLSCTLCAVVVSMSVAMGNAAQAAAGPSQRTVQETVPGEGTHDNDAYLTIGPGVAMYNGNVGWAINVGALKDAGVDGNLFWGADLGMDFYSFNSTTPAGQPSSAGATSIQLLPTAIYRLSLFGARNMFPFIGLSIGPNIYIDRPAAGPNTTNLYFEMLFRPGFFTSISRAVSLGVEAKLGMLRSEFVFLPTANFVFAI